VGPEALQAITDMPLVRLRPWAIDQTCRVEALTAIMNTGSVVPYVGEALSYILKNEIALVRVLSRSTV
jgi:hypothetical protein